MQQNDPNIYKVNDMFALTIPFLHTDRHSQTWPGQDKIIFINLKNNSPIKIFNKVILGQDSVAICPNCHGFSLKIYKKNLKLLEIIFLKVKNLKFKLG